MVEQTYINSLHYKTHAMKHLSLCLALCLGISTGVSAQFQPGDLFVRGNAGLALGSSTNDAPNTINTTGVATSLGLGYFLSPKLALGVTLGYDLDRTTTDSRSGDRVFELSNQVFLPQLFLRYYQEFRPGFGWWLDLYGGAHFGNGLIDRTFSGNVNIRVDISSSGFEAGLRPGLYGFISRRLALEASIGGLSFISIEETTEAEGGNIPPIFSETTQRSEFRTFLDGQNLGLRLGLVYFLNRAAE
jgi:hypothetical protein